MPFDDLKTGLPEECLRTQADVGTEPNDGELSGACFQKGQQRRTDAAAGGVGRDEELVDMAIGLQVCVAEQRACFIRGNERAVVANALAPGLRVELCRSPGVQLLRRLMGDTKPVD